MKCEAQDELERHWMELFAVLLWKMGRTDGATLTDADMRDYSNAAAKGLTMVAVGRENSIEFRFRPKEKLN